VTPTTHTNGDPRLQELRSLLVGPVDAEQVAGVLADAVRLRTDSDFRRALQPAVTEALEHAVQTNPRMVADALFPIFGQAIRKAITAELDGLLQSLTQTLEQRLSWRSLQWRWEAIRTRKAYAEIVLLRSLLYRVEQVFLIHRKTGLLLVHAVAPSIETKDPEMVSGMLTAIQDFVRDSISGTEGGTLDNVRVGDVGVVLAYGPDAILSGFVRGVAPRTLNRSFQATLDSIEDQMGADLQAFNGDTSPFEAVRPQVEACLLGQGSLTEPKKSSWVAKALVFGVPSLIIAALVGWWIYTLVWQHRWSEYAKGLSSQPGFVLTSGQMHRDLSYEVAGLHDPLAADPRSLNPPSDRVTFHWEDYHSLDPRFAEQRRFRDLKDQLERRAFRFKTGSSEIPPEQRFLLEDVASQVLSLIQAGDKIGKNVRIEVRGNHDPVGTEDINSTLAKGRAANVESALVTMGVPQARLSEVAPEQNGKESCSAVKEEERLLCRSASFRVID
jgi:OOP family OmpA-OmpF porin